MQAWQATVQDDNGNVVVNPSITVYQADGVTLAQIYNQNETPKANPFIGTLEGFVQFWAPDGDYRIRGSKGSNQTEFWSVTLDATAAAAIAARNQAQGFATNAATSAGNAATSAGQASTSASAALTQANRAQTEADRSTGLSLPPLFVLFLGQSNMRGNQASLGGDLSVPENIYVWNNFTPVHSTGASPTAGNQWREFLVGQFPSDLQVSGQYVLSMPHAIMRELAYRTRRRVYGVTVATGGQSIEAFLLPATRTSKGWTLPSGDLNLSAQMYPQLANALSAAPGSPSVFDAVFLHQGERNMGTGDTALVYRDKIAALMTDLAAQGVANFSTTQLVAGSIAQANPRYVDHLASLKNNLPLAIPGLKVFDSRGLIAEDTLHFNQHGISTMALRAVDAYHSPMDSEMTAFSGFTPIISDSPSGAATAGGSILGVWRRQGRNVIVHVVATGITTSGLTGANQIFIRNLPFPISDYATGSVNVGWTTFSGSLSVTGNPGNTYVGILDSVSGAALVQLPVSALASGSASIRFSLNYTTNF